MQLARGVRRRAVHEARDLFVRELLEVAQLYLVLAPQEPRTQTEGSSPLLAKCKYCVESTTRVAPAPDDVPAAAQIVRLTG